MGSRLLPILLVIIPWVSIAVIAVTLYWSFDPDACCWSGPSKHCPECHTPFDRHISYWGQTNNPYYLTFSIGFTVAFSIIWIGVMIKAYLWNQYQNVLRDRVLVINLLIIIIGLSSEIMMAWSPDDKAPIPHYTGTVCGAILCWLAMSIDAIKWFSFWRTMNCTTDSPNGINWKLIGITIYCILLSVAEFCVFVLYAICYISYDDQGTTINHEPGRLFEWIALFGICLLFLTQSIHGLSFYTRSDMRNTLYTPLKTGDKKHGEGMYVMTGA